MTLPEIKLWHDDIRQPPDESWLWVRTNLEAQNILAACLVTEISMDHDMGLHNEDPFTDEAYLLKGSSENNGLKLARWMCETNHMPPKIKIHSWNSIGAREMILAFADAGRMAQYVPYVHKPFRPTA